MKLKSYCWLVNLGTDFMTGSMKTGAGLLLPLFFYNYDDEPLPLRVELCAVEMRWSEVVEAEPAVLGFNAGLVIFYYFYSSLALGF